MTQIFFTDNNTLWETDGTAAGTHQVSTATLTNTRDFAAVGGTLFFANGSVGNLGNYRPGPELWRSDGTAAGTYAVATGLVHTPPNGGFPNAFPPNGISQLATLGGTLFFAADDPAQQRGEEPWISDGTSAGTQLLKDINPGSGTSTYLGSYFNPGTAKVNGELVFAANDGIHGQELWITDGTAPGTHLVKDIVPGATSSNPTIVATLNGAALFTTLINGGEQLWRTDGSADGTVSVAAIPSGSVFAVGSSEVFFVGQDSGGQSHIGRSDGTAGGTQEVAFAGGSLSQPVTVGDRLFFTTFQGANLRLGTSDGTSAGTQILDTGAESLFSVPVAGSTELFFTANDPIHNVQIWKSDGTAAGTVRVTDFLGTSNSTGSGQSISIPILLTPVGDSLFFTRGQNTLGGSQLFETDNSAAGYHEVINLLRGGIQSLKAIGGQLFFVGNDGNGFNAFVTDGTSAGTHELASVAGSTEAGTFFAMPAAAPVITVPPGSALASFDTTQNLVLDLTQADQPHNFSLSGNDTIQAGNAAASITATAGDDVINIPVTATGGLTFAAQGGNDTFNAAGGDNSLTGGSGHTVFRLTGGNEFVTTGSGTATIEISGGADTVVAGQGTSTISAGNASLLLGLLGGAHQVSVTGGAPIVLETGGSSTVDASAGSGAPEIGVFGGTHFIVGGSAGDTVFGVGGTSTINGGTGLNAVDLVTGSTQVNAGAGITELFVNGGSNTALLQSNGGPVLISGFDPALLHLVIASHINGDVFTDPSQIPTSHTADGSLLMDLGAGSHGEELVLLVGVGSIPASAITLV